jgi:hypothetical protein
MEGEQMADERGSVRGEIYHIRVEGKLDGKWADWFEGFVMTSRGTGETLLTGPVEDQAALHGVLGKIGGLGLPLLLVAQTGCPCPKKSCPRRGQCEACAAYHGEKGKLPFCFREKTKWDKRCTVIIDAD